MGVIGVGVPLEILNFHGFGQAWNCTWGNDCWGDPAMDLDVLIASIASPLQSLVSKLLFFSIPVVPRSEFFLFYSYSVWSHRPPKGSISPWLRLQVQVQIGKVGKVRREPARGLCRDRLECAPVGYLRLAGLDETGDETSPTLRPETGAETGHFLAL